MILIFLLIIAQTPPMIDGDLLSSNSVVLNEFMAHPHNSCTEADGEWIELFNNTNDWINLSGWTIENNYGQKIILATYLLPPRSYYVLAACGDESLNGGLTPNHVYGNFTIHDSGRISLIGNFRTIIDEIEYDAGWSIQTGFSCERINPGWVSNHASSWGLSLNTFGNGDMGTPGAQNSIYENSFAQNSWAFIKAFVE
ncbi:MAG: lamin tail domain-containing protein [Candidatus Aegiribacteria sp.]|nr:lamin tail domain-containing protein [Candidatus Aegiribacteria sp.]